MRYFNVQLIVLLLLTVCTAHAQEPVSADDFSQRGISRFEKNDLDGAIADFTKAIELNGHQLEFCFYFRGIALYRRGRLDEAIADLSKAITLKQHPRFYDDRGNLLAQKGDFDRALGDLNRAIEIDPKYAKAYGDRGIVRLLRGDDANAELDLKKCFELDKTLEIQLKLAVQEIKRQAVVRAEHQEPADVQIVKFSWNETPSRVLDPPSSPAIPVTTSPVSQTGLRVLGNMEKGEPGPPGRPPGLPSTIDPLGTPVSTPGTPGTRVRGVDHKFSALIRNTGSKTITNVQWAYFFVPQDGTDTFVYLFTTKIGIPPGKEKTLHDQMSSVVIPASQSKGISERNRALFKERVVIVRLDYADGTSWHSSGHR
ncbi:MAG TPA: tetratricopeptide repeat protein [Pyrinomonadaceae bacterium]|nr:tetratricopeptide repeat protein [Pyrinomonadaceae bacterium]